VDTIVEKGTEIGITTFQPIVTQHTLKRIAARPERWRQKAIAAMKQCGRSCCPQIRETIPFREAFERYSNEFKFIAHEKQHGPAYPFADWSSINRRTVLFVGPEGGFSDGEIEHALENGARLINLGSRRLRSDTACLVGSIKLLDKAAELGRK
jgi:16S rRNA (uracil1498-N3)-methyltransferase